MGNMEKMTPLEGAIDIGAKQQAEKAVARFAEVTGHVALAASKIFSDTYVVTRGLFRSSLRERSDRYFSPEARELFIQGLNTMLEKTARIAYRAGFNEGLTYAEARTSDSQGAELSTSDDTGIQSLPEQIPLSDDTEANNG